MIGSGWLFSAYYASKIAGPAVFVSWLLTSFIILLLGLSLAEIASSYPKNGLMARLLVLSHSKEFAFVCSISAWLGLTAVIATEAEGSVQYLSSISATIGFHLFDQARHQLTATGLAFATLLIFIFGLLNFWGAKLMSKSNNVITCMKILIPSMTAIMIMVSAFHTSNFTGNLDVSWKANYSAILSAMLGGWHDLFI